MTAQLIVSQLLEDNPSGVWIFGQNLPASGHAFGDLQHAIKLMTHYGLLRPQADMRDTLDSLIEHGYTIIEKKNPRDVVVYSRQLPAKTTPDGAKHLMAYLSLDSNAVAVHKRHADDGRGQTVAIKDIVFGSKGAEDDEKHEQEMQARPEPKIGQVFQERVSLGFTFDRSYKAGGCLISAVHPGGAMALAGLQAGDVIRSASYTAYEGGEQRERRVDGEYSMMNIMSVVDERYPIVLGVYRGNQKINFPVMAKPITGKAPEQQGSMHIPAAEVQKYAHDQDQIAAKLPVQGQPKPAPKAPPEIKLPLGVPHWTDDMPDLP